MRVLCLLQRYLVGRVLLSLLCLSTSKKHATKAEYFLGQRATRALVCLATRICRSNCPQPHQARSALCEGHTKFDLGPLHLLSLLLQFQRGR